MKKLITLTVALLLTTMLCAATSQFSEISQKIDQAHQNAELTKYSKYASKNGTEVTFNVKTLFSEADILDKNPETLSYGFQVKGTDWQETDWSEEAINAGEKVILQSPAGENSIVVNEHFQDKNGNSYDLVKPYNYQIKGCHMVPVGDNWLIGSIECIGNEQEGSVGYSNRVVKNVPYEIVNQKPEPNSQIFFDHNEKLSATAKGRVFANDNLVLVYIEGTPAQKLLADQTKANVYFFKDNIFSLFADGTRGSYSFLIGTTTLMGHTIAGASLKIGSYQNGQFLLKGISANGGDSLFYRDEQGAEYLVGFNAGKIVSSKGTFHPGDYYGKSSDYFFDLHEADYKFVKQTIQGKNKKDWENISKHMILL